MFAAVALLAHAAWPQARPPLRPFETAAPIPYFIAEGNAGSGFLPGDRELAEWALDAWRRTAPERLHLEPAVETDARIRVFWAPPASGQYGETLTFLLNGLRGAAIFVHPDMEALGANIARRTAGDPLLRDAIVYLTCLHELGHAFGLEHTADFADIMYSFQFGGDIVEYFGRYRRQVGTRDEIARTSGLSPGDEARFRALYAPQAARLLPGVGVLGALR